MFKKAALLAVAACALLINPATSFAANARWCANATAAVARHCPPQNPTPPGGNTCLGCAIALKNCDAACPAGTCSAGSNWYPPAGQPRNGEICPKPYTKYSCGTITINSAVMDYSGTELCEAETRIDRLIGDVLGEGLSFDIK